MVWKFELTKPFRLDVTSTDANWRYPPLEVSRDGFSYANPAIYEQFTRFTFREILVVPVGIVVGIAVLVIVHSTIPFSPGYEIFNTICASLSVISGLVALYFFAGVEETGFSVKVRKYLHFAIAFFALMVIGIGVGDAYVLCIDKKDFAAGLRPTPSREGKPLIKYCYNTISVYVLTFHSIILSSLKLSPLSVAAFGWSLNTLILLSELWILPSPMYSDTEYIVIMWLLTASLAITLVLSTLRHALLKKQFEQVLAVESAQLNAADEFVVVDNMLLAMLPESVLQRLMQASEDSQLLDYTEDASVLFSDMVQFTRWSSLRSPQQVVEMLNRICVRFDAEAKLTGVEKVKTIGDAYWAAAGLPIVQSDHLLRMLHFASRMLVVLTDENERHPEWNTVELRVGLASGPLFGAVFGTQRLSYEVFGVANKMAEECEKHGEPMRICLPAATARRCTPELLVTSPWKTVTLDVVTAYGEHLPQEPATNTPLSKKKIRRVLEVAHTNGDGSPLSHTPSSGSGGSSSFGAATTDSVLLMLATPQWDVKGDYDTVMSPDKLAENFSTFLQPEAGGSMWQQDQDTVSGSSFGTPATSIDADVMGTPNSAQSDSEFNIPEAACMISVGSSSCILGQRRRSSILLGPLEHTGPLPQSEDAALLRKDFAAKRAAKHRAKKEAREKRRANKLAAKNPLITSPFLGSASPGSSASDFDRSSPLGSFDGVQSPSPGSQESLQPEKTSTSTAGASQSLDSMRKFQWFLLTFASAKDEKKYKQFVITHHRPQLLLTRWLLFSWDVALFVGVLIEGAEITLVSYILYFIGLFIRIALLISSHASWKTTTATTSADIQTPNGIDGNADTATPKYRSALDWLRFASFAGTVEALLSHVSAVFIILGIGLLPFAIAGNDITYTYPMYTILLGVGNFSPGWVLLSCMNLLLAAAVLPLASTTMFFDSDISFFIFAMVFFNIMFYLNERYLRQQYIDSETSKHFEREQRVAKDERDGLLRDMVPEHVIPALRRWIQQGQMIERSLAEYHPFVTVAFVKLRQHAIGSQTHLPLRTGSPTDPVSTEHHQFQTPQTIGVALLRQHLEVDRVLAHFEGIEKIKTIGSLVMLAGPFSSRRWGIRDDTSEVSISNASLSRSITSPGVGDEGTSDPGFCVHMLSGLKALCEADGVEVDSIGVHYGEVLAAVLGTSRVCFDVFGDSVNVASRVTTQTLSRVDQNDITKPTTPIAVSADFFQALSPLGTFKDLNEVQITDTTSEDGMDLHVSPRVDLPGPLEDSHNDVLLTLPPTRVCDYSVHFSKPYHPQVKGKEGITVYQVNKFIPNS